MRRHRAAVLWCVAYMLMPVVMHTATAAELGPAAAGRPGSTTNSTQEDYGEEVLEEVFVEGYTPVRDQDILHRWLARLVGRFAVSGTVHSPQLYNGSTVQANGSADCIGIEGTVAPAVHCELDLRWPTRDAEKPDLSGHPPFGSAVVVFGYSVDRGPIIRHLLVDSEGKAEGASGVLISPDTLVSRAKCLSASDACERIVRITAAPDLRQVKMEIAIAIEQRTIQSLTLIMLRQP